MPLRRPASPTPVPKDPDDAVQVATPRGGGEPREAHDGEMYIHAADGDGPVCDPNKLLEEPVVGPPQKLRRPNGTNAVFQAADRLQDVALRVNNVDVLVNIRWPFRSLSDSVLQGGSKAVESESGLRAAR
eukprot:scaffold5812_cov232-Pinguiococcus_pyrenoidosus.AAC.7